MYAFLAGLILAAAALLSSPAAAVDQKLKDRITAPDKAFCAQKVAADTTLNINGCYVTRDFIQTAQKAERESRAVGPMPEEVNLGYTKDMGEKLFLIRLAIWQGIETVG